MGLDLSQHSERAYAIGGGEPVAFVAAARARPAIGAARSRRALHRRPRGHRPRRISEHWRDLCQDQRHAALGRVQAGLLRT